jgi:2-oxoglutarate dehydrogenase E2 component (dihydrolipoamide succinyltransferase)
VQGTGLSGRVTKQDILGYIQSGRSRNTGGRRSSRQKPSGAPAPDSARRPEREFKPGENTSRRPMSVMRKKIAEHMVLSAHTSPHVYSVYEVNFARVTRCARRRRRSTSGRREADVHGVHRQGRDRRAASVPDRQRLDRRRQHRLQEGHQPRIAVALDNGLIVPVIKNADEKNLLG